MSETRSKATGPASIETLYEIHAAFAASLMAHIKRAQAGEVTLRASWLAEVRQFLKENGVVARPGVSGLVEGLETVNYPFPKT